METHHIVPRCVGGLDVPENTIELSARAHAIISVLQSDHYNRPCVHRRQIKYLPPELLERGKYWLSVMGRMANAARVRTERTTETRQKMSESALRPEAQPPHKKAAQSKAVSETNAKKQPCPHCGKLMNIGNLTQHIRRQTCLKTQG
jgi:hypothetical protein